MICNKNWQNTPLGKQRSAARFKNPRCHTSHWFDVGTPLEGSSSKVSSADIWREITQSLAFNCTAWSTTSQALILTFRPCPWYHHNTFYCNKLSYFLVRLRPPISLDIQFEDVVKVAKLLNYSSFLTLMLGLLTFILGHHPPLNCHRMIAIFSHYLDLTIFFMFEKLVSISLVCDFEVLRSKYYPVA